MSSLTATIHPPQLRSVGDPLTPRLLSAVRSPAFWMLSDQAVVSLGNFATINLLARNLSPAQFGGLGLSLETMLFLNSLQAGLIIYPLTLRGAAADAARLRQFATAGLFFTLLIVPVLGTAMVGASWACGLGAAAGVTVAAMMLAQVQETVRRALISQRRTAECIPGDALSYLGQAVAIYLLARAGRLDVTSAFLAFGITSAAAALLQSLQIGLTRIHGWEILSLAREWWLLGRWMLFSAMTLFVNSISFMWALRSFHGLEAVATLFAVALLLKVSNPVVSSVASLIVPAISRDSGSGKDPAAATPSAIRYILLGACLLAPYFLLLLCMPRTLLALIYGSSSTYAECGGLLRIYVVNASIAFIAAATCAWLCGLGRSRANFAVQAVQSGAVICIGIPLTIAGGLPALLIGAGIGYLAQASTGICLVCRVLSRPRSLLKLPRRDGQS